VTSESPQAAVDELLLARSLVRDVILKLLVANALENKSKEPNGNSDEV